MLNAQNILWQINLIGVKLIHHHRTHSYVHHFLEGWCESWKHETQCASKTSYNFICRLIINVRTHYFMYGRVCVCIVCKQWLLFTTHTFTSTFKHLISNSVNVVMQSRTTNTWARKSVRWRKFPVLKKRHIRWNRVRERRTHTYHSIFYCIKLQIHFEWAFQSEIGLHFVSTQSNTHGIAHGTIQWASVGWVTKKKHTHTHNNTQQ